MTHDPATPGHPRPDDAAGPPEDRDESPLESLGRAIGAPVIDAPSGAAAPDPSPAADEPSPLPADADADPAPGP